MECVYRQLQSIRFVLCVCYRGVLGLQLGNDLGVWGTSVCDLGCFVESLLLSFSQLKILCLIGVYVMCAGCMMFLTVNRSNTGRRPTDSSCIHLSSSKTYLPVHSFPFVKQDRVPVAITCIAYCILPER